MTTIRVGKLRVGPPIPVARSTAQAGDWSDPTTWTGGIVPAATDTATVNHAVTIDADTTIAGLTINAPLDVATGARLTLAGDCRQYDAAFAMSSGSALRFDCRAADRKWVTGSAWNQANARIVAAGSANPGDPIGLAPTTIGGNHVTIDRIGAHFCWFDSGDEGSGVFFNSSGWDLAYADLMGIGTADGSFAIRFNDGGAGDVKLIGCTFDNCGTVLKHPATWNPAAADRDFIVQECRWEGSPSGSDNLYAWTANPSGGSGLGVKRMVRSSFDRNPHVGIAGATYQDNYFDMGVRMNSSPHVGFSGCVRTISSDSGTGTLAPNGDVADLYFVADHQDPAFQYGNQHYVQASGSDHLFERIVFEFANSQFAGGSQADGGDGIFGGQLADSTMRYILSIPDPYEGVYSANLFNPLLDSNSNVTIEHVSIYGKFANMLTYEYHQSNLPSVAVCRSNLIASDSNVGGERAYFAYDSSAAVTGVSLAGVDVADPVGCTHNYIHNPFPFTNPETGLTHDGWVCQFGAVPAGPTLATTGAGYGSGPVPADPSRRFAEWAVFMGAASSGDTYAARKLAARNLLSADPTLARTSLIPWVMAGWAPTASVLDPATNPAHDGGTIGAVPYGGP